MLDWQLSSASPLDFFPHIPNKVNCCHSEFIAPVTSPQLVSGKNKFKSGLSNSLVYLPLSNQAASNVTTLQDS
jgi:hypothetical protein